MNWIKGKYKFDVTDITTLISVIAVILTMTIGGIIPTIIFILNCAFQVVWVIVKVKRINLLILQLALLAFNFYFLLG